MESRADVNPVLVATYRDFALYDFTGSPKTDPGTGVPQEGMIADQKTRVSETALRYMPPLLRLDFQISLYDRFRAIAASAVAIAHPDLKGDNSPVVKEAMAHFGEIASKEGGAMEKSIHTWHIHFVDEARKLGIFLGLKDLPGDGRLITMAHGAKVTGSDSDISRALRGLGSLQMVDGSRKYRAIDPQKWVSEDPAQRELLEQSRQQFIRSYRRLREAIQSHSVDMKQHVDVFFCNMAIFEGVAAESIGVSLI